jgi:predicted naringenin-chalcone synthase
MTGGRSPTDVDRIMTVPCTGSMIPSLDAHLINEMGLRSDVRRLPITELGLCRRIRDLVDAFLKRRALTLQDITAFILHPGGQKLLAYIEEQLGLCRCDTELSWHVLNQCGNLSSATILFILHEWLTKQTVASGDYGLAAAFGPGFSTELLLLQWP